MGLNCVKLPNFLATGQTVAERLYIPRFIEIRPRVLEPCRQT